LEMVKALVSLGADVTTPVANGATPIYNAAEKGHCEVVKALASFGCECSHEKRGDSDFYRGAAWPLGGGQGAGSARRGRELS
jgi:hypothetical protein